MSNALQTAALLEAIRAAAIAAWSVGSVDYGQPRTVRTLPYAIVYWDAVEQSFETVSTLQQVNRFRIIGRFANPASTTDYIDLQKVIKANAMIAQLQSGATFASIGYLPIVTSIDPSESDPVDEGAYEITLTFEVRTECSHH